MLDRSNRRLQGVVESDPEGVCFATDDPCRDTKIRQLEVDGVAKSARRNAKDARAGYGDVSELHELRTVGSLDRDQFPRRESFGGSFARTFDADKAEHHENNQIVPGPSERRT